MGTRFEEQAVVMTTQEHVRNAAVSSSNAGESEPPEQTRPGCGQIKTKARYKKCYEWRGGNKNKFSNHKKIEQHLKNTPETTTSETFTTSSQHKISPESETATA